MFYAIYMVRGFALVLVPVYFIKHSVSCYIYYISHTIICFNIEIVDVQGRLWKETVAESPTIEENARRGGRTPSKLDPKMLHDIQTVVSRLAAKSSQLVGNETTNMAEGWMHVRSKYDGGKVINRSQSGSWEHRCMGAGLQQNLGKDWGPSVWSNLTKSTPNSVFSTTAKEAKRRNEKNTARKSLLGSHKTM